MSERDAHTGVGGRAADRTDHSGSRRTDYLSVEAYVDDFLWRLRVSSRARRRIRHEVAAHLAELVAEEQDRGLILPAAARRGAARFGSPSEIAEEFNHDVAVHDLRRSVWALAVCVVAAAFAAAGGALHGWGPAKPWPRIRGLPLPARPVQLAARSVTGPAFALVPVAVVSAGNIPGSGRSEGAISVLVAVSVPVAVFWSVRAAFRADGLDPASHNPESHNPESTLDVLVACSWAPAERWSCTGHAYGRVTNAWSRAVDRAPALMSWFELRRHPWRTACTVSLAAGIALKAPDLLLKGEVDLPAALIEAAAVFVAYRLLGGLLGLRERVTA